MSEHAHVTRIRRQTGVRLDLRELRERAELLGFLVWREVKIRYKQTAIGFGWAVLQPLLLMIVFSLFFGRFAGVGSDGAPYPVFSYAGLLAWTYFSTAVGGATNSVVNAQHMISKVYFPRVYLPLTPVLAGLLDVAIASTLALGLLVWFDVAITWRLLLLPLAVAGAAFAALGPSLLFGAANALYRDLRYAVPFLMQVWFFVSPVVYPLSAVPEAWRLAYSLNPMVGAIEAFRWCVTGATSATASTFLASGAVAIAILGLGLVFFRRVERRIVDVV